MMTKEQLLNQISVQQIYEKFYKGIYSTSKNVSSPFSNDKNPSLKFFENGTFKCFSTGKQGDVFQFIAYLHDIDCKKDFHQIIKLIQNENFINLPQQKQVKNTPKKTKKHFLYTSKNLTKKHKNYFLKGSWNVNEDVLKNYQVQALDKFEYYNSNKKEITKIKLFAGVLGFIYSVNNNVELYIPKQNKVKKFFYNQLQKNDIFGLGQLPPGPVSKIIIAAGKKDCLILNANGYYSVSFRSENHYITKEQIKILKDKLTPTGLIYICYDNDIAGINASTQWATTYNIIEIKIPDPYNDVADFFLKNSVKEFDKLIQKKEKDYLKMPSKDKEEFQGTTIFHIVERYLQKHYDLRFNTILLDIEYKQKHTKEWKICNEDSLFIEMQKKGINIQMAKLISILKSDFVPKFNPITNYFKTLPKWCGKDYIKELCSYISTPTPKQFEYHLKKWLARSIKCMLIEGYFNKQAFIITDKGSGQNIGKSHLTKWLCPPTLPVNRSFEDSKKDNLIKLATNTFILLDELDGISRKDLNSLKALFSMDEIRVRLPYARREETVQRIANFIGSTNEESFLNDPTGSVRWLVFHITAIDWNYSKKLDVNKIWAQAYALAKDKNFDESFTRQDVIENEKRNQVYQVRTPETEMIAILFEVPTSKTQHKIEFLTSTEILIFLKANSSLNRLSPVSVGKALKLLKFPRVKKGGSYGYNVVRTNKILTLSEKETYKPIYAS